MQLLNRKYGSQCLIFRFFRARRRQCVLFPHPYENAALRSINFEMGEELESVVKIY